jgi:DNA-binding response OmpR family regulator
MATSPERVTELLNDTPIDVAVIDAATPDAYGIVRTLRRSYPKVAVVWIGSEPPETTHAQIAADEADIDHLPGVVTRALIARRA